MVLRNKKYLRGFPQIPPKSSDTSETFLQSFRKLDEYPCHQRSLSQVIEDHVRQASILDRINKLVPGQQDI